MKICVAGQDLFRLLLGVLRKVAQDDDDFVLDVERRVAVVREALRLGLLIVMRLAAILFAVRGVFAVLKLSLGA